MSGSLKHGTTLEMAKKCKPRCHLCERVYLEHKHGPNTDPFPKIVIGSPQSGSYPAPLKMGNEPDIVGFLHSGRFNAVEIDIVGDQWGARIIAHGDKYMGYGVSPDYALFAAIKRFMNTDPQTGPITMTVDRVTNETSEGNGLDDHHEVGIEHIWELEESLEDSGDSSEHLPNQ